MQARTSIRVLRDFIVKRNDEEEDSALDASGVLSVECFEAWCSSRKTPCVNAERQFRRTLIAHLGALDGRTPFTPEEERAVLIEVRKNECWPCFQGREGASHFGKGGFRSKGYHERRMESQAMMQNNDAAAVAATQQEEEADLYPSDGQQESTPACLGDAGVELYTTTDFVARQSNEESIAFWEKYISSQAAQFEGSEAQLTEQLSQTWRYVLYARTSACSLEAASSRERAETLCQTFSQQFPGQFVCVVTAFSHKFSERVLAENAESVRLFGSTVSHCPSRSTTLKLEDMARVFRPCAQAWFNPGNFYEFTALVECKSGEWRELKVRFIVDPESLLLVTVGEY